MAAKKVRTLSVVARTTKKAAPTLGIGSGRTARWLISWLRETESAAAASACGVSCASEEARCAACSTTSSTAAPEEIRCWLIAVVCRRAKDAASGLPRGRRWSTSTAGGTKGRACACASAEEIAALVAVVVVGIVVAAEDGAAERGRIPRHGCD